MKNHRIFHELPGQAFDAYDQCQVFLRDPDAGLFSSESLQVCGNAKTEIKLLLREEEKMRFIYFFLEICVFLMKNCTESEMQSKFVNNVGGLP